MKKSRSDFLFEFRSQKARVGVPTYVGFSDLFNLQGFGSVFGVTLEQAAENVKRGATNGANYEVYCDTLLVDFDDCTEAAQQFGRFLKQQNIAFIEAHSGGRSEHFHVTIEPMFGVDVPNSLRQWVAIHAPRADVSIYQPNGMFRLFGTKHHKSGKPKRVTSTNDGRRLYITYVEKEWRDPSSFSGVTDIEGVFLQALSLLNCEPTVGNRHQILWSLAKTCSDCLGDAPDLRATVEGIIYAVNGQWQNKKEEKDLQRILRDIFKN